MAKSTLTAVVDVEEGVYVAKCPEVGTEGFGETAEEALRHLKEETKIHLEEFISPELMMPVSSTDFDISLNA